MATLEQIIIPIAGIFASIITAYITAKQVTKASFKTGKVLLLEIIKRYIIILRSSFDDKLKIKTNEIDRIYYLSVLTDIYNDLKGLGTNPLLIKIFINHPELTNLSLSLHREIVELNQPSANLSVNKETLIGMINLFDKIKIEFQSGLPSKLKKDIFTKNENLREFVSLIEEFRTHYMPHKQHLKRVRTN